MDTTGLLYGDFSSVAGKWVNGKGHELQFNDKGLVSETEKLDNVQGKNPSIVVAGVGVKKPGTVGGYVIFFIPAGFSPKTINPGCDDRSDKTRDRLWAGQDSNFSQPESFFYRVQ